MGKGKAGVLKAEGQLLKHSTSKVGRPALWTQAQRKAIDESIPAWLHFALVLNKGLDGVHKDLQKWKKDEANRLLSLSEFKVLPPDVRDHFQRMRTSADDFAISVGHQTGANHNYS